MTPRLVWDIGAELGEGPVWDAARSALWFVDIKGHALHRFHPGDGAAWSWPAPDQIGFALPADDGSLVCGLPDGLYRFDPETGEFALLQSVEADRPHNRLNDGYVAPDGSLWFGSMDNREEEASGALYRWSNGRLEQHDDGYVVTNGPALSPDQRTLYHHDTLGRRVFAFDHADGQLANKRLFAEVTEGYPDGVTVDAAGVLHIGLFNGGGVARYSPAGEHLDTIRFPVCTVTKAAFGGPDLRQIYCTTAWLNNGDKRKEQPTLGGLFRLDAETPGLPPNLVKL